MSLVDDLFTGLVTFCIRTPGSTAAQAIAAAEGVGLASSDSVVFFTRFGARLVELGWIDAASWIAYCARVNEVGEARALAGINALKQDMRKSEPIVRLIDARDRRSAFDSQLTFLRGAVGFAQLQIDTDGNANRVALFVIARDALQNQLDGLQSITDALDEAISQLEIEAGVS